MAKFKIEYKNPDLETEELDFFASSTSSITAREWAEDHAYTRSDKEAFKITEINKSAYAR